MEWYLLWYLLWYWYNPEYNTQYIPRVTRTYCGTGIRYTVHTSCDTAHLVSAAIFRHRVDHLTPVVHRKPHTYKASFLIYTRVYGSPYITGNVRKTYDCLRHLCLRRTGMYHGTFQELNFFCDIFMLRLIRSVCLL